MHPFKKVLRSIVLTPVMLVLLFEEWGWEPLARAFSRLGKLPLWAKLERIICRLPSWAALVAFGVPVVLLIPIKLLALYLFSQGHIVIGVSLVVTAKIAGTALAARLFQLTEPALMRMAWFARIYLPWKGWKDRMLRQVRDSTLWRSIRRLKFQLRLLARKLWGARKSKSR